MLDGLKRTMNLYWAHQRRPKEHVPNKSLKEETVVSRARNERVFQVGRLIRMGEMIEHSEQAKQACLEWQNHAVGSQNRV